MCDEIQGAGEISPPPHPPWSLQHYCLRKRKLFREQTVIVFICIFQVEKELQEICKDVLGVIDEHLIPNANPGESKVFYYKM